MYPLFILEIIDYRVAFDRRRGEIARQLVDERQIKKSGETEFFAPVRVRTRIEFYVGVKNDGKLIGALRRPRSAGFAVNSSRNSEIHRAATTAGISRSGHFLGPASLLSAISVYSAGSGRSWTGPSDTRTIRICFAPLP